MGRLLVLMEEFVVEFVRPTTQRPHALDSHAELLHADAALELLAEVIEPTLEQIQ